MQLERVTLYYWGVAQRKPSMLAERCCSHEVLKESCEDRTTRSAFPFCLLRVSVKCKGSQERNSMLVLPFSSTACWKGIRFTGYLLNRVYVKMQIPRQSGRSSQERILTSSQFCSDMKYGQQTSPIFHVFSVISVSFMAMEDVGIVNFLCISDWDV